MSKGGLCCLLRTSVARSNQTKYRSVSITNCNRMLCVRSSCLRNRYFEIKLGFEAWETNENVEN